jgi:hypothetical protein
MVRHAAASTESQAREDFFAWELPVGDFPVYSDETLALWRPIALIVCSVLAVMTPHLFTSDRAVKSIAMFLGTLVPFLIASHGDIASLVRKPRWRDIPLVLIALALTMVVSLGPFFAIFCYLRTKNILKSYAMHVTQDLMLF